MNGGSNVSRLPTPARSVARREFLADESLGALALALPGGIALAADDTRKWTMNEIRAKTLGYIEVANKRQGSFNDEDEGFLMLLASITGFAMDNEKLNRDLHDSHIETNRGGAVFAHEAASLQRSQQHRLRGLTQILDFTYVEHAAAGAFQRACIHALRALATQQLDFGVGVT